MSLITDSIRKDLTVRYSHPSRHYHSTTHITSLLALLETHRDAFTDAPAVEAAIWFHDAIYDARAEKSRNELESATLAVETLKETVDHHKLERIRVMIEATASHTPPTAMELGVAPEAGEVLDAKMFLDMDLCILGAEEGEYDVYEAGVRGEYAHLSDEGWRKGRAGVLRGFLLREKIFYTELFRELFEERARINLRRAIARLEM